MLKYTPQPLPCSPKGAAEAVVTLLRDPEALGGFSPSLWLYSRPEDADTRMALIEAELAAYEEQGGSPEDCPLLGDWRLATVVQDRLELLPPLKGGDAP